MFNNGSLCCRLGKLGRWKLEIAVLLFTGNVILVFNRWPVDTHGLVKKSVDDQAMEFYVNDVAPKQARQEVKKIKDKEAPKGVPAVLNPDKEKVGEEVRRIETTQVGQ